MEFLLLLLHFSFMILAQEMKNYRNVGFILNAVVVNEKFFGPIFMTQTLCVKWLLLLAAVRWSQHWCGTYCVSLLHTAQ